MWGVGVVRSAKSGNIDLGDKWVVWGKPSPLSSPLTEVLRRQVAESGNSSFTLDFKHDRRRKDSLNQEREIKCQIRKCAAF